MNKKAKIYIAGHNGMVGSAICRALRNQGYSNLILKSSNELDLRNQQAVNDFFETESPEYVFLAAAKVGGILANLTYKADFIYDNLMIQNNIIHNAYKSKVKKLLFLGSSCIYPKMSPQPISENYLLTGSLERTNEPYSIAKISGVKLCEYYREQYGFETVSLMPSNLYGPNDNFDLKNSHVLPALLRKFHEAKLSNSKFVDLWGTGFPKREFLFVDDLAEACLFIMSTQNSPSLLNVGTGKDLSILELAELIKGIVGFEGGLKWDYSKPDGTPRKLLDVNKINNLGWVAQTSLIDGIKSTYKWYVKNN
jgi:GDP-L-fucose synthase